MGPGARRLMMFEGFDKLWILFEILKIYQMHLGAPGGGSVRPGPGPGLSFWGLPLCSHMYVLDALGFARGMGSA